MEKKFVVSEIILSELVALNSLYYEGNTCNRQSMCEETALTFCIALKETFSTSITSTKINKFGNVAVFQIATVFRPVYHVPCRRVL